MGASIDAVAVDLPAADAALMKLSPDPARTVADVATNAGAALALKGRHSQTLSRTVAARHGWDQVAARLAGELGAMEP